MQLPVSIRRALGAGLALAALAPAAAQAHVTRYANPTATATSGDCSAAMPCKIGYAVNGASPGDEVVVAPGSYASRSRSRRRGSTSTASRARRRRC